LGTPDLPPEEPALSPEKCRLFFRDSDLVFSGGRLNDFLYSYVDHQRVELRPAF